MEKKNYIEGDKIINTSWFGRVDVFQIVDEFPCGYSVWNIGRQNFPFPGYLPLARFDSEYRMIDGCVLKAVKTDEALADEILKHRHGDVDYWKFKELERKTKEEL